MHVYLGSICVVLGAAISFSFGMWNESLTFLLVVMAVDYISGVAAAMKDGSGLNSNIGFWGLFKKGLMLLIVMIAHRIDLLFEIELAMGGAITFYIVNELLSVMENYGRLGMPFPPRLRRLIQVLRDRVEDDTKDE
ncbi:MAG: phage holin family protein [Candidatus Cohnella colombiensis]|uniref:Phage holin family protein n=1 Tax=Candidatus Cohnella colombiensis TaxID=3121368 RepID=A0AA95EXN2_9BACL|nr:MAG: phage holin family protein [Cohnella sp.]